MEAHLSAPRDKFKGKQSTFSRAHPTCTFDLTCYLKPRFMYLQNAQQSNIHTLCQCFTKNPFNTLKTGFKPLFNIDRSVFISTPSSLGSSELTRYPKC